MTGTTIVAATPVASDSSHAVGYRPAPSRRLPLLLPLPLPPEKTASVYERYAAQYAAFRHRACPDDRAEGLVALDLPHARHAAEVGCGPGYYAPIIAARHPTIRVTGIDNSPSQIALARQRAAQQRLGNARFVCDDACALSQPDGCFDRIVASRLFMVIHDCRRALTELRRVLAPDGLLLIAEPIAQPAISFADWAQVPTPAERIFTTSAFAALVSLVAWGSCAIWETGGYRYARCRKATD
ncbi:MAG: class I SAM-dependent methyltransferase [Chloroflexota bacterium]|nr:class I SAM-dependent methyltransferase [Chloroflexota bacterium]MDQ6907287.1 class I SAM-dependent methyltransferase [Chloroflexota bacterium]